MEGVKDMNISQFTLTSGQLHDALCWFEQSDRTSEIVFSYKLAHVDKQSGEECQEGWYAWPLIRPWKIRGHLKT